MKWLIAGTALFAFAAMTSTPADAALVFSSSGIVGQNIYQGLEWGSVNGNPLEFDYDFDYALGNVDPLGSGFDGVQLTLLVTLPTAPVVALYEQGTEVDDYDFLYYEGSLVEVPGAEYRLSSPCNISPPSSYCSPAPVSGNQIELTEDIVLNTHDLYYANGDLEEIDNSWNIDQWLNGIVDADDIGQAYTLQIFETALPEPSTWAMMLIGFGGVGFMLRAARRKNAVATA